MKDGETLIESPFMENVNLYFATISMAKEKFNFFPSIIAIVYIFS